MSLYIRRIHTYSLDWYIRVSRERFVSFLSQILTFNLLQLGQVLSRFISPQNKRLRDVGRVYLELFPHINCTYSHRCLFI